ncbi:hypothetical protein CUJ90_03765 [Paraburkholderia terricola]|nr:hypothetical protein CUJ90_03765 [Paraburkholderia terricola]
MNSVAQARRGGRSSLFDHIGDVAQSVHKRSPDAAAHGRSTHAQCAMPSAQRRARRSARGMHAEYRVMRQTPPYRRCPPLTRPAPRGFQEFLHTALSRGRRFSSARGACGKIME